MNISLCLTKLLATLGLMLALSTVRGADLGGVANPKGERTFKNDARRIQGARPGVGPPSTTDFGKAEGEKGPSSVVSRTNDVSMATEGVKDPNDSIPLPNTMSGLNDKRPLAVGDKLSFKVVEDEGAPRSLTVTDSYEVDVPYIGRVPVANKTCKQLAYYVKSLLEKDYYFQATVIIGLDAAGAGARTASRGKVYVMGQVRKEGPQDIPIDEVLTVSKAILRAGGFGPYANKKKVRIMHGGGSGYASKPTIVDCVEILEKGKWDKDVELNPEDIVTVPEKLINLF